MIEQENETENLTTEKDRSEAWEKDALKDGAELWKKANAETGAEKKDGKNALLKNALPEVEKENAEATVFGKFKSPEALYDSYTKLEAEFTRKSQRLKRLKELCERNGIFEDGEGVSALRTSEKEKTEGPILKEREDSAKIQQEGKKDVSDFLLEDGETLREEGATKEKEEGMRDESFLREENAEIKEGKTLLAKEKAEKKEPDALDVEVKKKSVDEIETEIKEKIIREYLASVAEKKIPLMRGGGVGVTAEKQRARTVYEAGGLALRYFKNGK